MKIEDLGKLIENFDNGHSRFQLQHFVIAMAGLTPYGMWRQAQRELDTRLPELCRLNLEILELEAKTLTDLEKLKLYTMRRDRARIGRESVEIARMIEVLQEPFKDCTDEQLDHFDAEHCILTVSHRAKSDMADMGRLSSQTEDMIRCLPSDRAALIAKECLPA